MPARKRRLLVADAMDRASLVDMTTGMMGWRARRAVRWILLSDGDRCSVVWRGNLWQPILYYFFIPNLGDPIPTQKSKSKYVNNAIEHHLSRVRGISPKRTKNSLSKPVDRADALWNYNYTFYMFIPHTPQQTGFVNL